VADEAPEASNLSLNPPVQGLWWRVEDRLTGCGDAERALGVVRGLV